MRGIVPVNLDNTRKVGLMRQLLTLDLDDPEIRDELLSDSPIYEHVKREKIEKLIQNRDMPNSKSKFYFLFKFKIFLERNFSRITAELYSSDSRPNLSIQENGVTLMHVCLRQLRSLLIGIVGTDNFWN